MGTSTRGAAHVKAIVSDACKKEERQKRGSQKESSANGKLVIEIEEFGECLIVWAWNRRLTRRTTAESLAEVFAGR